MHNSESVLENEMHKRLWGFEIQTDHLISTRQPDYWLSAKKTPKKPKNQKTKKKTKQPPPQIPKNKFKSCRIVDFEIGALGAIPKGLVKKLEILEIRGQMDTIQTTALPISVRILRKVLET